MGEHDYTSRGLLAAALEQVDGHVVVDLSSCTLIDTAVLGAIIGKALPSTGLGIGSSWWCLERRHSRGWWTSGRLGRSIGIGCEGRRSRGLTTSCVSDGFLRRPIGLQVLPTADDHFREQHP
jgi:hypothetical protein